MATDNEKRLENWTIASKKYCDLLEDMLASLKTSMANPDASTLRNLTKKVREIHNAGRAFLDDIKRARPPRSPEPDPYPIAKRV